MIDLSSAPDSPKQILQKTHDAEIHDFKFEETVSIRKNLLSWFDKEQRVMPWRKKVDYPV